MDEITIITNASRDKMPLFIHIEKFAIAYSFSTARSATDFIGPETFTSKCILIVECVWGKIITVIKFVRMNSTTCIFDASDAKYWLLDRIRNH